MKRANGLDLNGNPMTVRGGIADILLAIKEGRMLLAYSGGLHHVQVPGHMPRPFKTVRMRVENLDIGEYIRQMMAIGGPDQFKKNVMKDLDRRRDMHAPEERTITFPPTAGGSSASAAKHKLRETGPPTSWQCLARSSPQHGRGSNCAVGAVPVRRIRQNRTGEPTSPVTASV